MPAKPSKSPRPKAAKGAVTLLVGTQKGLFFIKSDKDRVNWKVDGPAMLGGIIDHVVADPRRKGVLLMGARTGHLGPTVYRSEDSGKTWKEAKKPPAFPKAKDGEKGRTVKTTFWMAPGHASEPDTWFCGTIPFGLFKSTDGGNTWKGVSGFNTNAGILKADNDAPPGGPFTHSIMVDPRDANHMFVGLSVYGFMETKNGGRTWAPLNKGCEIDFMPPPPEGTEYETGHDPHCVSMCAADPDRLWMQNHCGIYRMDRAEGRWHRVGRNMPKEIGDIGFGVAAHPRDPDQAWVFPMDGTSVWPRTSPGGKPAAYHTADAGKTWQRLDSGLPKEHAYYTVFRQAIAADSHEPVGVYFGCTQGDVWAGVDDGRSWKRLASGLPRILSVTVME